MKKELSNNFVDLRLNLIGKKMKEKFGSGITLTNNEIKDIMKGIKSLENRATLLKGTTKSQTVKFINIFRPLMTASLQLMKNLLTPFPKKILIPLRLSARMPPADAAIQKRNHGSGITALPFSNKEMEDIMKIVKSFEESRLLIKGISETIKNEGEE